MTKHLRYSMPWEDAPHPQIVMKNLGITYQHATPQSIADQWWFWNCENVPDDLPKNITVLELDPFEAIGYGLTEEDARRITNYEPTD